MLATTLIALAPLFGGNGATQEQKLLAPGGLPNDWFGNKVALAGDTALISAVTADPGGVNAEGLCYVCVRDGTGWVEQATLARSAPQAGALFGSDVALQGDTAVVGATGVFPGGRAIVFTRTGTTWSEQATLAPNNTLQNLSFGRSVAIDGDTIVVGAPHITNKRGSAYVFVRTGTDWSFQKKLQPATSSLGDGFGVSVDVQGELIVIGAPGENHSGLVDAGAAYAFERSGTKWTETNRMVAGDPVDDADFGSAIDLDGDSVAVGSSGYETAAGAVYVCVRDGTSFIEQAKVTSTALSFQSRFGATLSLQGGRLAVGARGEWTGAGASAGAVYLFSESGGAWSLDEKLFPNDPAPGHYFGESVSIDADGLLIGAFGDVTQGFFAGAAYVFNAPLAPSPYCTAGSSANGCAAQLSSSGTPSASSASGFVVTASNVEGAKDGLFFFGANGRQANSWGNGSSYQCVVPPVRRAGILSGSGTSGVCDGSFAQDLNARWQAVPQHNPGAGAIVQLQLWYRDPAAAGNMTTSLSDALEFSVCP
jgi:hypothetical protein